MDCKTIRPQLGEFHDGELAHTQRGAIEQHLLTCAACRAELDAIGTMARALGVRPAAAVPPDLWENISQRLDRGAPTAQRETIAPGTPARRGDLTRWRPWATAAAVVLVCGLAYLTISMPPAIPTANARSFDFAPLLDRLDDLGAGLQALIDAYGGHSVTLAQAATEMKVRVHPPQELPGGLRLESTHMVNVLDHESLAFHFVGPKDQLLVMQCPAGMVKKYGGRECMACQVGARAGHVVREGEWNLFHIESDNVCICVVSTMDKDTEIPKLLKLLKIEY